MSKQSNQSKQKNKEGTKLILCEVLRIIKQEQTCPENNKIRPGHKDCFTLIGKGGLNRHFRNPGITKKDDWSDPCQDFW